MFVTLTNTRARRGILVWLRACHKQARAVATMLTLDRDGCIAWLTDPAAAVLEFPDSVVDKNGLWSGARLLASNASTTHMMLPSFPQRQETFWLLVSRLVVYAAAAQAEGASCSEVVRSCSSLRDIVKWLCDDGNTDRTVDACKARLEAFGVRVCAASRGDVWAACLRGQAAHTPQLAQHALSPRSPDQADSTEWLVRSRYATDQDLIALALLATGAAIGSGRGDYSAEPSFKTYLSHLRKCFKRNKALCKSSSMSARSDVDIEELSRAMQEIPCFKRITDKLVPVKDMDAKNARAAKARALGTHHAYSDMRYNLAVHLGQAWTRTAAGEMVMGRYHARNAAKGSSKTERCDTSRMCPYRGLDRADQCAANHDLSGAPKTPSEALTLFITGRRKD